MELETLALLLGGLIFTAAGLYIIINKKNAFKPVSPITREPEKATVLASAKAKENAATSQPLVRKVPLEKIALPEGFPRSIVLYYGT